MISTRGHLKLFAMVTSLLGATVSAGVLAKNNTGLLHKKQLGNGNTRVLNDSQKPTLVNGAGTMSDDRGTLWEYENASNYSQGHVSLGHQGYFGIKSTTPWAIPGITSITVDFSEVSVVSGEFWLLKSVDGIEWHEVTILEDDEPVTWEEDWRFVRFYFWDNDSQHNSSVNVNEVRIQYSCENKDTPNSEAVDSARYGNVVTTVGLSHAPETSNFSPKTPDSNEAIKFTKTSGSTSLTLSLNNAYTLGDVYFCKIEFDIYTTIINYDKTIEVLNVDGTRIGSKFTASSGLHVDNPTNSYVWSQLEGKANWYHAELPMSTIVSVISGYDDKNGTRKDIIDPKHLAKQFNAIRINAGTCVIDNLRVGSSACEAGNYNSSDYQPTVNEIYWVKTTGVGKLYKDQVTITFSDSTKARQIPYTNQYLKKGSPFYIELLAEGELTITVNMICGFDHRPYSVSKTINVKLSK